MWKKKPQIWNDPSEKEKDKVREREKERDRKSPTDGPADIPGYRDTTMILKKGVREKNWNLASFLLSNSESNLLLGLVLDK